MGNWREQLTTYDKTLAVNLDPSIYGVFAEIGAGQETANWFFRVSASAGTVAKSISAYDMTMSDVLYGKTKRYVSEERLSAMLAYEYDLLDERLREERGETSTFFSFCNTVRDNNKKKEKTLPKVLLETLFEILKSQMREIS